MNNGGKIGLRKNIEDAIPEFGEPTSVETVHSPYTAKRYYWKRSNLFFKDGACVKTIPFFTGDGLYVYTICGCIVEMNVIMISVRTRLVSIVTKQSVGKKSQLNAILGRCILIFTLKDIQQKK